MCVLLSVIPCDGTWESATSIGCLHVSMTSPLKDFEDCHAYCQNRGATFMAIQNVDELFIVREALLGMDDFRK